jgi:branched-chain amino acid transport system substrate-binding protein
MGTLRRKVTAGMAVVLLWGGLAATAALAGPGVAGASSSSAPVKIGLLCACTGPISAGIEEVPPVAKAWVDSVNAAGGINGHKIDLIVEDDTSSPSKSTSEAQTLVGTDHVVAIIDATSEDFSWASYVQAQGVPVVGLNTSTEPFYTNSDFYPEGQTEDSLFFGITAAVHQAGGKDFALFYCAEAVQCQEGIAPLEAQAKTAGEDVVAALEVSASAPNYTAQCLAAKQAGATVAFVADVQTVDEKIIQDCYAQGYKPKVVVDGETIGPSMATSTGFNVATYFTVPNLPYFAKSSAISAMDSAVKKYSGANVLTNSNYNELAAEAWMSGKEIQAAVAADHVSGAPTSAEITKGLNSFKGQTLDGLAPALTYTAGKPHPVDCWYYALLKDGKYSTPQGLKTFCASS